VVLIAAAAVVAGVLLDRQIGPAAASRTSADAPVQYVGTIRDIMHAIVEPAADAIFDSVEINVTSEGVSEKQPKTDAEWEAVEHGAIALAEAVVLIKMAGRPVARPDEMHIDPEGPELPPSQVAAHIARSQDEWNKYADGMQRAAIQTMNFARARDVKGLYEVGTTIDDACEACHLVYWYPDDLKNRQ
jgi:hypothetical protein